MRKLHDNNNNNNNKTKIIKHQTEHEETLTWFINEELKKRNSNDDDNYISNLKNKKREENTIENETIENRQKYNKNTTTTININEHNRNYIISTQQKRRFQSIKVKVKPKLPHPLVYFSNFSPTSLTSLNNHRHEESNNDNDNNMNPHRYHHFHEKITPKDEISTDFLTNNDYVIHKETCLLLSNLEMKEIICKRIIDLVFYSDERTILFALKIYQLIIIKLYRIMKNYYVNESSTTTTNTTTNTNTNTTNTLNLLHAYEFFLNAFKREHNLLLLSDDTLIIKKTTTTNVSDGTINNDNDNDDDDNKSNNNNVYVNYNHYYNAKSFYSNNYNVDNCLIVSNNNNDDSGGGGGGGNENNHENKIYSSLKTPRLKRNKNYINFVVKTVILQWKIICLTPWGLNNAKILQNYFPYHVLAIINLMKDGGKSQIIKDKRITIIPSSPYTSRYWLPLNDLTHLGFQKKLITDAMNYFSKAYNSIIYYKLPIPADLIEETVRLAC